jgi:hypothetical protein
LEAGTGYLLALLQSPLEPLQSRRTSASAPWGSRGSIGAQIGFEHRLDKPDLLLVRWEAVKVSLNDAYKIRRTYRRLAKMRGRGHLHRLTVFVRHENVVRLLEFLGYRQEE